MNLPPIIQGKADQGGSRKRRIRGISRDCHGSRSWNFILRSYQWFHLNSASKLQMATRDTLIVPVWFNCLWTVPRGLDAQSCGSSSRGRKSWCSEKRWGRQLTNVPSSLHFWTRHVHWYYFTCMSKILAYFKSAVTQPTRGPVTPDPTRKKTKSISEASSRRNTMSHSKSCSPSLMCLPPWCLSQPHLPVMRFVDKMVRW